MLRECLETLIRQKYRNLDILIVDNTSTDGTNDYIKDLIANEKVYYVNTGKNIGGAGGFNYGMKETDKMNCDYMWLMDDDCIVKDDTLIELLNADEELNSEYCFLSSKVLWKDNNICNMNVQKVSFTKKS